MSKLRQLREAVGPTMDRYAAGSIYGGLSGGVSNYLAGGDMDHAIRGAVLGAGIGAVPGIALRNSNQALRFGAAAGIPALLALQKDRPMLRDAFNPESTDTLSSLYSADNAFEEGSPAWEAYYAENPEAYAERYEKTAAAMTLDDIALMEEMSGQVVGRTRTKVGTVVDSNGVYTLYDNTGDYTYGEFTKLSEALYYAEKLAQFSLGDAYANNPGNIPQGQNYASDWSHKQDILDKRGRTVGTANVGGSGTTSSVVLDEAKKKPFWRSAESWRRRGSELEQFAQEQAKRMSYTDDAVKITQRGAPQALPGKAPVPTTVTAPTAKVPTPAPAAPVKAPLSGGAKALRYGGGALGLAGLGYLGYQYFKPEDSWTDRAQDALSSAAGTAQKYLPYAQQAMGALQGGNLMGYSANPGGGQYQNVPQYPQQYRQY
jgi:hypothetical protein